jgi:hypothetical protein
LPWNDSSGNFRAFEANAVGALRDTNVLDDPRAQLASAVGIEVGVKRVSINRRRIRQNRTNYFNAFGFATENPESTEKNLTQK